MYYVHLDRKALLLTPSTRVREWSLIRVIVLINGLVKDHKSDLALGFTATTLQPCSSDLCVLLKKALTQLSQQQRSIREALSHQLVDCTSRCQRDCSHHFTPVQNSKLQGQERDQHVTSSRSGSTYFTHRIKHLIHQQPIRLNKSQDHAPAWIERRDSVPCR